MKRKLEILRRKIGGQERMRVIKHLCNRKDKEQIRKDQRRRGNGPRKTVSLESN